MTTTEHIPAAVDWADLVAHEPRLDDLLAEARSIKADGGYFCNHEAYAFGHGHIPSFKRRLHKLVGFGSTHRNSLLATEGAWDAAVETITEALPACRCCGCVDTGGNFIEA